MQKGFYLDLMRCTSCYACVVACKAHHAIQEEAVYWRRMLSIEIGIHPKVRVVNLSLS
jgi:Fe-S-cluster-containing dehydrogenase component